MKNNMNLIDSFTELTLSELAEINGGAYNIWYAIGYAWGLLCNGQDLINQAGAAGANMYTM